MSFAVAGDKYDRFMGRYSRELAPRLIEFAGVEPGMAVVDVGCGPGALTERLVERTGAENVAAADPSEPFVAAATERAPGADVRLAPAEELPWEDDRLRRGALPARRELHARRGRRRLRDAPGGAPGRRGRRVHLVLRRGHGDAAGFWDAARRLDSGAPDEGSTMRYRSVEELGELWRRVGLAEVETGHLRVETSYTGFDDLWEPFTLRRRPGRRVPREALARAARDSCARSSSSGLGEPSGPFTLSATACAVRGSA